MSMAEPQDCPPDRLAQRGQSEPAVRGRILENDLLHVFVTVVLCRGFTAAARVLNRTQAAVSMQIKRLEEVARVQLLERSSRGVVLTAKGATLFEYAQRILALNEEAMLRLRSEIVAGPVRIGTYNHFASEILPEILTAFQQLYPEVWVELHVGLSSSMLARLGGEFDLVVGLEDRLHSGSVRLRREPVSWYSSIAHRQHERDPLPIAILPEGSLFREWAIDSLARCGRNWRIAQVCTSAFAIEAAVAAGLAVGVFKQGTVRSPALRAVGPDEGLPALPSVDISIKSSPGTLSIAAQRLRDFIIERVSATGSGPRDEAAA